MENLIIQAASYVFLVLGVVLLIAPLFVGRQR